MSELTNENMRAGIILSYISVGVNFISFFIFYFSKSKNNSILANLFMLMSVCECIGNYITAAVYQDFAVTVNGYYIRKIFTFLTFKGFNNVDEVYDSYLESGKLPIWDLQDTMNPSYLTLLRVNNSIYSSVLTFALLLNLFYRLEVVYILKYPISNWGKRHTVYLVISYFVSLVSFIITFITEFDDSSEFGFTTYKSIYLQIIESQYINGIILIMVILASIISIIYVSSLIFSKSRFYSKERLIFGIKHLTYMITYCVLYIYSDIALAIDFDKNMKVYIIYIARYVFDRTGWNYFSFYKTH
jgi:hypothetical protein